MAKNCVNCGKSLGLFSGENEIIQGTDRLFCDNCFKAFGLYVNIIKNSSEKESIDNAYSQAIPAVQRAGLSSGTLQETIQDIDGLYKERCKELEKYNEVKSTDGYKTEEPEKQESYLDDTSIFSIASGDDLPYVVIQVTLKEKLWGTGSGNLTDLERVINEQVKKGYRVHTMTTSNGGSKGVGGGDRIQATLLFEKVAYFKNLGW